MYYGGVGGGVRGGGGSGAICLGAMVTPPVCLSVIASVLFHSYMRKVMAVSNHGP